MLIFDKVGIIGREHSFGNGTKGPKRGGKPK